MDENRVFTVLEAAEILKDKGIIQKKYGNQNKHGFTKINTGEQQVRKWIREYNNRYKESYEEYINKGEPVAKAEKRAMEEAELGRLRATIKSNKTGYEISAQDLEKFIEHKTRYIPRESFDISRKEKKQLVEEFIKSFEVSDALNSAYKYGFEQGMDAVLKFLEKRRESNITLEEERIKKLPKNDDWLFNCDDLQIKSIRESKNGIYIVEYRYLSMPEIEPRVSLYKNRVDVEYRISFRASVPAHQQKKLKETLKSEKYKEFIVRALDEKADETSDELRLGLTWRLDELKKEDKE